MPYIDKSSRARYASTLAELAKIVIAEGMTNGDLNFLMSKLAAMYVAQHGETYNTLSDAIKAFECAKLEFYRRKVVPYEDKKIAQNGDLYD